MYLIFDTETTGLPIDYKAPHSNTENWPRVVQLAWIVFDSRGRMQSEQSLIVCPKGFEIPSGAERVHGISTAIAKRKGVDIEDVLETLLAALLGSSVLVAHNLQFDAGVLGAEFYRFGVKHPFRGKTKICTMESSTEYCKIPGNFDYKWPSLAELHRKLFRKSLKERHDAGADAAACSKCFFELVRLGVIKVPKSKASGKN